MRKTFFRVAAIFAATVTTTALMAGPAPAANCLDCMDPDLPPPGGGSSCPTIAATTDPWIVTSGPYRVGQTVTGNRGTWSNATSYKVRWYAGTDPVTPFVSATSTTVSYVPTSNELGKTLRLQVYAYGSDTQCLKSEYSAPTTTVQQGTAPIATTNPVITGTPKVGATLHASAGVWSPAATSISYTWSRGSLTLATTANYTPTASDLGANLQLKVQANRTGYAPGIVTLFSGPIQQGDAPTVVSAPAVSGEVKEGVTLTATPGTWSPAGATVTYQWQRAGVGIPGATQNTYTPTTADVDQPLSLRVQASLPGRAPATTTITLGTVAAADVETETPPESTEPAPAVVTAPVVVTAPQITGKARFGSTLKVSVGTWSPAPTQVSYQWLRNGVAIPKATTASYRPVLADIGRRLSVKVSGTANGMSGHITVTVGSVTRAAAPKWTKAKPTIKGKHRVGVKLQVKPTKAKIRKRAHAPGAKVSYQWLRNGKAIAKQTKAKHKVVKRDRGKRLRVRITITMPGHKKLVIKTKVVRISAKAKAAR